jgi:hypothetical protein
MKKFLPRRPSASMLVAMTALVVALSGTAVAATSLVNGDKLIKKGSLSGNRLRNHTLTGTQINLNKLGKVPSAKKADTATSATKATSATTATTATAALTAASATTATNANALGGAAPSAYEPSAHFVRTGLVTATSGQVVNLASFGSFTLKLNCVAGSGAAVQAEIDATSTVANSDGYGTQMATAGTSYTVLNTFTSGTTPNENDDNAADFFTPAGQTYVADLTVGQNYPGFPGACFANALVSTS